MSFNTREVERLVAELGRVPAKVLPVTEAVVNRGALNVKQDWSKRWSGLGHLPGLSRAINYDVRFGAGTITAEIGADKSRRQGPLANIAEYGTPKTAPRPGGGPALAAEEPRFVAELAKAAERVVGL